MTWRFADDLAAVHTALAPDWPRLRGARIYLTGGTGLLGRWLLEALRDADQRLSLGVAVTILTRDPAAFAARAPHLAGYPAFRFVTGDVLTLEPSGERFTHVIHAATDASASRGRRARRPAHRPPSAVRARRGDEPQRRRPDADRAVSAPSRRRRAGGADPACGPRRPA